MPCSDGGPSAEDMILIQARHDTAARLACEYCQSLERAGQTVPEWAQEWWQEHQDDDRVRKAIEEATERNEKLRLKAVSKLTKEEREALGIK